MPELKYINTVYSVEMELSPPPSIVFDHLTALATWWPEQFTGTDFKQGSEFVLTTGEDHYSKNMVEEFVEAKKLVWLTTESTRKSDGYDWSGTRFIFELTPKANGTLIRFTYDGVVLENEQERLAQICDTCIKVMLYNAVESFSTTIEVANSPDEIFQRLTRDVAAWWGGKDLSGSSIHLEDEFIINHPGAHYSKQKLIEVVPGKRLVWLVTESNLSWLKNQEEWTNTRMVFEIIPKEHSQILKFTHQGLTPNKESFVRCAQGWKMVINDWLYNLILYSKPHFEQ